MLQLKEANYARRIKISREFFNSLFLQVSLEFSDNFKITLLPFFFFFLPREIVCPRVPVAQTTE